MIVLVGGDGRGVGKTALVCAVIQLFPAMRWTAVKVSPHVEHSELSHQNESDTARMLAAGAERAMLMCAPAERMQACAGELRELGRAEHLIVESTSVRAFLEPDLFLCVVKDAPTKLSLRNELNRADALFIPATSDLIGNEEQLVFRMQIEHGVAVLDGEAKRFLSNRVER